MDVQPGPTAPLVASLTDIDPAILLATLRAFRRGDFTVRMPAYFTGTAGEIAEAFNDVLEATRQIREIDPQACVLVSTGYSTDPVVASPEAYGFRGVISKPWELSHLDHALRRLVG